MKSKLFTALGLFLALAACTLVLAACGGAKNGPDSLAAPTDFAYNGSILSWGAVEGAEKYSVVIGSGEPFSTGSTGYPFINTSGETFTVSVTAMCEGMENSPTATHTFVPLQSVTSFTVTPEGALAWEAVEGAVAYQIEVDGGKTETVTAPLYTGLAGGTHSVRVKPVGSTTEPGTSYYAAWSTAKSITRLSAVAADTITYSSEGNMLTWGEVTGATKYRLIIEGSHAVDVELTTRSYALSASDDFTVRIIALGDNNLLYNSAPTEKTFVCLDAVTDLHVADGMLQWSPVDRALGYRLRVNGSVQGGVIRDCFYSGFPAGEQFTVSILPVTTDNASFSLWSADVVFSLLETPVLKWNNYELDGVANNNLYWNSVQGAAGYEVKILLNGTQVVNELLGAGTVSFAYMYELVGDYSVSVRALASSDATNRYTSNYSTPITVRRLAAPVRRGDNYIVSNPTELTAGFTAAFFDVAGASAYRVWRDGNVYNDRLLASVYTDYNVTDGTSVNKVVHTYKIQSVGSLYNATTKTVVLDSLSRDSLTFDITVLPAPTAPAMSGYVYSFTPIEGAFGYGVRYGNTVATTDSTSYDLVDIQSGSYQLSVCARGNGGAVLASPYSTAITLVRLSAPGNIEITTDISDGVLKCSPVDGASSYLAMIDGVSEPLTVSSTTNVKRYISEEGTSLYMIAVANEYKDNARTVYYMTSPASGTVTFIKLSTPTELQIDGAALLWNAPGNVKDATFKPTYRLTDASGSVYNGASALTVNRFDMEGLDGGKSYAFYVKAIGDGRKYVNSDSSDGITAIRVNAPEVTRKDGAYLISSVRGAGSYAVYVDGILVDTIPETGKNEYMYVPTFTVAGTYEIRVVAVAGEKGYFNSLATLLTQEVRQLQAPTFEATLSGGLLTVNITAPELPTLSYVYTVNGGNGMTDDDTFTTAVTGTSATVRVYAIGGVFDAENIYYIDSQSSVKTVQRV